jgi:CheY-like chemotaxis protein
VSKALKILIVEDEVEFSDYLTKLIRDIDERIAVTIVGSRDDALCAISDANKFYDFITLDLNIPSAIGGIAKSPNNGLAVLGECRHLCPGTPVLVLTASSNVKMISAFLDSSHQIDIWAEGSLRPTIGHLEKEDIDQLGEKIESINRAVTSLLTDVELIYAEGFVLPVKHDRLLRVFVRGQGGVCANVKAINGGLSGTKVYSVNILNAAGKNILNSVAKCGCLHDVIRDSDNYDKKINRLLPDVTPRKLQLLPFGAMDEGGVFYGLASAYESSFFRAASNRVLNHGIFCSVQLMTQKWVDAGTVKRIPVQDVRRSLVDDDVAYRLIEEYGLSWAQDFESKVLQSKEAVVHGDLHGENILVDTVGEKAVLIDYGDVSSGSCVIDPLTLECSFLFHPDGGLTDSGWPSIEQVSKWADLDAYVDGSPVAEEIRFCRRWSDDVKVGNREVAACLYSYALRQLKYPQTNKGWALELLGVARGIYDST